MLTEEQLYHIMPTLPASRRAEYLPHLAAAMQEFDVTTRARAAMFLAQWAHESGELKFWRELWGPTAAQRRYEGRRDLGNTHPGDGFRYRGAGPPQLTGRANFRHYGQLLGLDLEGNPELAATPEAGFRVAGAYWQEHGLNALADRNTDEAFRQVTRKINGGYNGLDSRRQYWRRALQALPEGWTLSEPVKVLVNGKEVPAAARREAAGTVGLLRPVLEALGCRVDFDEAAGAVRVTPPVAGAGPAK